MMPGIGFGEMVLLAIVAIVVVGPKDLPLMMRKFGRFTGKMRAMAFEFRQGFEELGRQAELDELRKEVADLKKHTGLQDLERDLADDKRRLESDVLSATMPTSGDPAPAQQAAPAETSSRIHPAGAMAAPAAAAATNGNGTANGHAAGDEDDGFRIEGSRPAASPPAPKQDVPA
jgi:sec-independent protein translocase protein TatB